MPPWLPERGEFPILGERRLRDDQIDAIQRWVNERHGSKEMPRPADAAGLAPTAGSSGQPDEVLTPARPYQVTPAPRTCIAISCFAPP